MLGVQVAEKEKIERSEFLATWLCGEAIEDKRGPPICREFLLVSWRVSLSDSNCRCHYRVFSVVI